MMDNSKPFAMGLIMGPLMLWMVHGQMTGTTQSTWAITAFVMAHAVIAAVLIAGAVFAARLSPRARFWLARLHRPSLPHIGAMVIGALASGFVVHISLHGIT